MAKRITREEGLAMLKEYGTPEHVIRHCIAVTDTAHKLADAINACGRNLNQELIEGAGIIHDIARVHDHHEIVGYEYARSIGLFEEAEIIKVHMRYPGFNDISCVNETDLVCLADRTVKEDRYVGIDERIEYIINKALKAGGGEEARTRILAKKEETKVFIHQIEELTGKTIDEICR